MDAKERIIIALDDVHRADALVEMLAPHIRCFKIGLPLITAGLALPVMDRIRRAGREIFYDAKFNDKTEIVAEAARIVADFRVKFFTVHASAGPALRAAVANKGASKVLAVTVLTSFDDEDANDVFAVPIGSMVLHFAQKAAGAGADGIICSPLELDMLNEERRLRGLLRVTPGIRPAWSAQRDQARHATPREAILAGADYLIIGSPITDPPPSVGGPLDALQAVIGEVEGALIEKEKRSSQENQAP